jgi:hypothetical protein
MSLSIPFVFFPKNLIFGEENKKEKIEEFGTVFITFFFDFRKRKGINFSETFFLI